MIKQLFVTVLLVSKAIVILAGVNDSLITAAKEKSGLEAIGLWKELGTYYIETANDSLSWLADQIEQENHTSAEVEALKIRAISLYISHQFDSSIAICHKGYELAVNQQLARLSVDFDYTRALCYLALNYNENAESLGKRVARYADSIDYVGGQVKIQTLLSNISLRDSDMDEALERAKAAFEFANQTRELSDLTTVHQLLGNVYIHKASYAEALENYLKALELASENDLAFKEAAILNSIGIVHAEMGNTKQAESYYLQSKSIRTKLGDVKGVGGTLISLGNLWVQTSPLRAKPYYEEALQIYRGVDDQISLAKALTNISNSFYYSGDYEKALAYALEALKVQKALDNQREVSLILMNLGYSYMQLDDQDKTITFFKESYQLARENADLEQIGASLIALGDGYEHFKNSEKALLFRNKYLVFNDSLQANETAAKIAELEVRYKTQLKEKQIEALTKEAELSELRLQQNQVTIAKQRSQMVFFVSFFFLFLLMIYSSYKRLKLKKQREIDEIVIRQQKAGLAAVVTATEKERKRIAKDLHDGIAQTLSGVKLGLDQLWSELSFDSNMQQKRFGQTLEYLTEACDEVRSISHQMMPAALNKLGLVQAIDDFLEKSLAHTRFNYSFEYFGFQSNERFSESIEVNVFRVTQELIQNVIKHSGASEVKVLLIQDKKELVLKVEDNGIGLENHDEVAGMGLDSVQGRVSSLGGIMKFERAQNTGLIVHVRIPLEDNESN